MFSHITSDDLLRFALAFVPGFFGIICHEVAHGWVAFKQGDPTAKFLGRLTLNPLKHLDPAGTLVFVLTSIMPGMFMFGWAKPVPVNGRYFKKPREGMMAVSLAGPLANIAVAVLCALIYRVLSLLPMNEAVYLAGVSMQYGILINCGLAWFNLLPIPPLDGSHILAGLLPRDLAIKYEQLGRYGMIFVLVLVAAGVLGTIIGPFIRSTAGLISHIAGFSYFF